jgi:hypothetical protein
LGRSTLLKFLGEAALAGLAQAAKAGVAVVAGRTPRLSTLLFLPVLLLGSLLVPLVLGVAGLERLVAIHTSTELLLPLQALEQKGVVEARHQRPAAVGPLLLELAQPSILVEMVAPMPPQTEAAAVAAQPVRTEMALTAAGVALPPIPIPAAVAVALVAVLLAKTAFLVLSAALAATTHPALAAA